MACASLGGEPSQVLAQPLLVAPDHTRDLLRTSAQLTERVNERAATEASRSEPFVEEGERGQQPRPGIPVAADAPRQGRHPLLVPAVEISLNEAVLGWEALVETLQRHTGGVADVVHSHRSDATCVEELASGCQHPVTRFLVAHVASGQGQERRFSTVLGWL